MRDQRESQHDVEFRPEVHANHARSLAEVISGTQDTRCDRRVTRIFPAKAHDRNGVFAGVPTAGAEIF